MSRRTSRRGVHRADRARTRARWVLAAATLGAGALLTASASASAPPAYAAEASVDPGPYYIGDALGSTYAFVVRNTGTSTSIGAVEITRPSGWSVIACPTAPAGWLGTTATTKCRYRSATGTADDIAPGASATFGLRAKTDGGNNDRTGTGTVVVSSSSLFDNPSLLRTAAATGPGLTTPLYTFELTGAVVSGSTPAAGSACPPAASEAVAASTTTIVVCGRNHANVTLTPVAGNSSLGGTFVGAPGTFASGPIPRASGVVVLATWSGTTVGPHGTNKTVVASVGAASNRTSPLATFGGFSSTSRPPVANADAYAVNEDTTLVVAAPGALGNDTDPDGDPLTASNASTPAHGTVALAADGSFTYTPSPDYNGTDSFTYQVTDSFTPPVTGTVTIDVRPVPDAPVAGDDNAATGENAVTAIPVLANDTDADGDALTVSAVTPGAIQGTVTNHGTHVSYDPGTAFDSLRPGQTATETFTYTVTDGALTDVGTVTVTINGENDAPVARDDAATTTEDAPVTIPVTVNDSDADGPFTVTGVGSGATRGTVTDNGNGTLTYDPAGEFDGLAPGADDSDSFTYTITDEHGLTSTATVAVTVTGLNDAPVAVDDTASASEDAGTTVDVLGNDTDAEGSALTVTAVSAPSAQGVVTNHGTYVTYDPNGAFEGLAAGQTAVETFTYTVSDGTATASATGTVTVTGVNDAPVAGDDAYSTIQETALTVPAPGVLGNDTDVDSGATVTARAASDPAHGSVTVQADGSFTYTPDNGFTGSDSFTYEAFDGAAGDTATVTVAVAPPNVPPTADAATASGNEDGGAITVTLTGHDADGDALTFDASTASNGLVTVPSAATCDTAEPSTCTATVTYTPNPNFYGSDSFTYTVNDGSVASAPATVSVTVNPVNDAPSFTKGANQTVAEDAGPQLVSGWATGISAGPANESGQLVTFLATTSNDALFGMLPAVGSDGTLTFTPADNANGTATVTVRATDDGGTDNGGADTSAPQTFTITVTPVADAPNANDDTATTTEDAVANIAVLANDADPDGDAVTISGVTNTDADGNDGALSVNLDKTVRFDPRGEFDHLQVGQSETDTFTYTISDGSGSDTATVTVTVTGVNDAPRATPKSHTAIGNTLLAVAISPAPSAPHTATSTGHLLAGVTDPDDTTFTASSGGSSAAGGTVAANADGSFTFLPAQGFTGTDTFSFTVTDAHGGADTDVTTVSVANMVWYVDAAGSATGTGRSTQPFTSLAPLATGGSADTRDGAGDHVFVYSGTYAAGIDLEPSQRLWGQPHGLSVAGTPLVPAGGSNPVVSSATGDAIVLANGVDVQRVDAGSSAGAGIKATGVTSATVGANTAVADTVTVTGGSTGTVSIGSAITNASAVPVTVANRTGGTVTFSGDITATGAGVALTGNSGGTVSLTGRLTLTTGVADAFKASGGGTISAPNTANTVATTTGTAIDVQGTTIGAADLVFRSVSANGADNGIVLANTGSVGNLAVLGSGTPGSGGVIRDTSGVAVALTNTNGVALGHLTVQDARNDGITADALTDLTLTGVQVLGAGDGAGERAVELTNVRGTVTVNGGTYDDASDALVRVANTNADLTLAVSNGARFANQTQAGAGHALDLVPDGTTGLTVTVDGSTFSNLRRAAVNIAAASFGSTGTSSVSFTNNTVNGGTAGGGGVVVNGQDATRTTLTVTGTTFTGAGGAGVVTADANDASTVLATVASSTITGAKSAAIVGTADEDGDIRMRVDGNTIGNAGGDAIQLANFGDDSGAAKTSTAHFVVTNNTVNGHSTSPATANVGAIVVFHFEADADTTCAKVAGNTVTATPAGFFDVYLQGDSPAGLRFEEVPDTAATGAVATSYVHSLNPGTTLANIDNAGAVYSNGTACTNP